MSDTSTIVQTVKEIIQQHSQKYGSVTASEVHEEAQARGVPASKPYIFTIFYQLHNAGKVTKIHRGKYRWTAEEALPSVKETRTPEHTELNDDTISQLATFVTDLELAEATHDQVEVALQYFFTFKATSTQDRMAS